MSERKTHWDAVYKTKDDAEVSWFEASPDLSLSLLREAGLTPDASVIDIGGGLSRLVDALAAQQDHVAVLDISAEALAKARARLPEAVNVEWIVSDITAWQPSRQYDFWHDRAALHFLTEAADQHAYLNALNSAVRPGGKVVIGTFAPDGPEKCSGLPVVRHDARSLEKFLGTGFRLIAERRHDHETPWQAVQRFQFSTFEKIGG